MVSEIWQRHGLQHPPTAFGKDFLEWLHTISSSLLITFVDPSPMDESDLSWLQNTYGVPHPELRTLYQFSNPWGGYADGPMIWEKIITRAYSRYELLFQYKREDLKSIRLSSPVLWPVMISDKQDIAAFVDQHERLAVVEISDEKVPMRPLSVGLRNYFVANVIAEILLGEDRYQYFRDAWIDPLVTEAAAWPVIDPPRHPLFGLDTGK